MRAAAERDGRPPRELYADTVPDEVTSIARILRVPPLTEVPGRGGGELGQRSWTRS